MFQVAFGAQGGDRIGGIPLQDHVMLLRETPHDGLSQSSARLVCYS